MSILIYFLKRFLQLEINLNPIDILLDSVEICLKIEIFLHQQRIRYCYALLIRVVLKTVG